MVFVSALRLSEKKHVLSHSRAGSFFLAPIFVLP